MRHATLRTTLAVALAAALPAIPARSATMTSDTTAQRKQTVRRIYEECIGQGRMEMLSGLIADEFVGVDGSRGPAAFEANIRALRAGFPDIRFTIEDVVAEGDHVAVRWTWNATHTGTFRGWAPSGRSVTDTGIALYRFAGARIVSATVETDRLGVLQQIGVLPKDLKTLATAR